MSTAKKIGISFGVLIFVLCLVVCCWYLYILEYGAQKLTSTVINPGVLNKQDGTSEYVIEVKYNSNQNGNGLELFDVQLNYFTDSNRTNIYTQGVQYVANNPEDKIEWVDYDDYSSYVDNAVQEFMDNKDYFDSNSLAELTNHFKTSTYKLHTSGWWIFGSEYKASYYNVFVDEVSTSRYEYEALDNSNFTGSTNPITSESSFLLQTGEEYVRMMFKGDNYVQWNGADEFNNDSERIAYSGNTNYYYNYNIDYLAYSLYQSIQELPAGTQGTFVFEFGDIFNYFTSDLDNMDEGTMINKEDTTKVINDIKSYYTIYVTISADGARNSQDSSFGLLHGSPTFTLDGSSSSAGNYFQGKSIIDVDVYDFDLVNLTDNYYGLKLKQEFIEEYLPYSKNIFLSVTIDVSIIENAGYKYSGLLEDSGLSYFEVLECSEINTTGEVA